MFAIQLLIGVVSVVTAQATVDAVAPRGAPGDASPEAVFQRLDRDGDGALSLDEFRAGMDRRGGWDARAAGPRAGDDRPVPRERRADRQGQPGGQRGNKADGPGTPQNLERRIRQIVRDAVAEALRGIAPDFRGPEFRRGDRAPGRGPEGREPLGPGPRGRGVRDGRMGPPPAQPGPPADQNFFPGPYRERSPKGMRQRGGRGRLDGGPGPRESNTARGDRMGRGVGFNRLDVNGDGFLSREEFRGPPERFDGADQDGDGQLDHPEFREGRWHRRGGMPRARDERGEGGRWARRSRAI